MLPAVTGPTVFSGSTNREPNSYEQSCENNEVEVRMLGGRVSVTYQVKAGAGVDGSGMRQGIPHGGAMKWKKSAEGRTK